ncbi:MAG: DEAD/DEAH box helicase, partial [Deltaproteobacteria bacterium]|nr:DEAD/DEAH box helicase [Deltaproteobacteria bacterium]
KNFVALSGQAHFLYPKSSKSRIFLRDLETQSQIINALSQQEIFIESSSASALNNSAILVLKNSQKLSKSISDIHGIPIEIFISEEVKNVVKIKPLTFFCEYAQNDINIQTNLSRSEFSLLVEAISSEAYFNNKFLVFDSCLILPNLESIENLSLFLSYYGAEPDYQNCKFYIKQPNNLLLYSFAKFCSSTKGFQLIGFEKVMSKLKTIQAFTKQNFFKLYGYLRDYQNLGVSWLYHLYKHELGGLLADEMGLGKTVQTLVLIDYLKKSGQLENALVICPTSVVRNWEREALRFTPDLDLIVYHGPKRKENLNRINLASLVITTYPVLRYDSIFFQDINFSLIVIDEAQLIKNVDSLTTKTVKVLKSKVRLALTGTPVENRPLDLWSIFDFISERSLGSKRFFLTMVEKNASKDILDKLASSVKPFILRRLKCETLKSLPPKNETVEYCEMTETQREIYDIFAQTAKKLTTEYKSNKAIRYTHIFSAIMKLRQICNHPASLPEYAGALELTSGKMIRLLEILDELIANGRKVVIFCQFIQMIKLISDSLSAQGVQHYILTGQTKNRQEIVELFNSNKEPSAFVMSLKAGGLGINLTGASDVVLYDPWWNPQVENQAIDRLHRIGQEKIVFVYRLITVDSIESRMEQIKSEKRDVFDRILKNNFSKIDVSLLTNLLL